MPFENRSREADDAFFVDGIHDDILMQLSKVSALKVISRTSVERFRKTDLSVQQIAQQLGVRSVLEGGVQRAGDRVRIHVQLIDATTDDHLWAESYDRELTAANIFAIQSEVAAAIAGALQTALTPAERARVLTVPTMNLEAWEAYQIGKRHMATRNAVDLADAERLFRKAIDLDPEFALAYAELANTLSLLIAYGGAPVEATLAEAEKVAAHALKLNPNLAEAWSSSGMIAWTSFDYERADRMLRRAIELNANYATAYHWLSGTLADRGRPAEALELAERAVKLDPFSAVINGWLGNARGAMGRFDEALAAYRRQIEIEPTMASGYSLVAGLQVLGFGRVGEAIPWQEKAASLDPGNPDFSAYVAQTYWNLGNDIEARTWLDRALAIGDSTPWPRARSATGSRATACSSPATTSARDASAAGALCARARRLGRADPGFALDPRRDGDWDRRLYRRVVPARARTQWHEPADGPIVVTGATGGVGCVAVDMLAAAGYESSPAPETGAVRLAARARGIDLRGPRGRSGRRGRRARPLMPVRFAGAVDKSAEPRRPPAAADEDGASGVSGLWAARVSSGNVMPFILRGVGLLGNDSGHTPIVERQASGITSTPICGRRTSTESPVSSRWRAPRRTRRRYCAARSMGGSW